MIDQLEAVDVRQVVDLLEPAWQRAHVLEALVDELDGEEAQHGLVELSDRDFTCTLLLLFAGFGRHHFVFIEAEQANVIAVLVV